MLCSSRSGGFGWFLHGHPSRVEKPSVLRVAGVLHRRGMQLLPGDLRPGFDVLIDVEEFVYGVSIEHIITIIVFEQFSSALLWSRRLLVARLIRGYSCVIVTLLLAWS